jgi:hypothetical protein
MNRHLLVAAAFLTCLACEARAKDLDKLDDKELLAIYDIDRNGVLSPAELKLYVRDLKAWQLRKGPTPTPRDPAKPTPVKAKHDDLKGVLLVRDVYAVPAFLVDGDALSKNGATFSVTNDRLTGQTTLAGKGSVFYAFYGHTNLDLPGTVSSDTFRMTRLALVPGLEWDIKAKNGNNTGSVSARAGAEFEFTAGGPIETQIFRANAVYTTDVATNQAEIYGIEASWMPLASDYSIGIKQAVPFARSLYYSFIATLNSDFFHVGQTASFANLTPNHDYWWVGPKLQATLSVETGPFADSSLYAKYFYLYDVLNGRSTAVNYFQTGVVVGLSSWESESDPTKRAKLSFEVRYTTGRAPRTLERSEELYAGLSVKVGDLPK